MIAFLVASAAIVPPRFCKSEGGLAIALGAPEGWGRPGMAAAPRSFAQQAIATRLWVSNDPANMMRLRRAPPPDEAARGAAGPSRTEEHRFRPSAAIKPLRAFQLLLAARILSALLNLIHDCDETFNYLEPLHFIVYGSGMQTWEYSATFALRPYVYLLLQAAVVAPAAAVLGPDRGGFVLLSAVHTMHTCPLEIEWHCRQIGGVILPQSYAGSRVSRHGGAALQVGCTYTPTPLRCRPWMSCLEMQGCLPTLCTTCCTYFPAFPRHRQRDVCGVNGRAALNLHHVHSDHGQRIHAGRGAASGHSICSNRYAWGAL